MDVRKPLKRWKKIRKASRESSALYFKYERLSTFCYICGLLGHSDKFCDQLFIKKTLRRFSENGAKTSGHRRGGMSAMVGNAVCGTQEGM